MEKRYKYHKLITFLFVSAFALFLVHYSLFLRGVRAQVPTPDVPCEDVRPGDTFNPLNIFDQEFHSLRPYQASPCDKTVETVIACGNDLIVQKEYNLTPAQAKTCTTGANGSRHCEFEFTDTSSVKISLPDAELPIVGNTQLVANSQNQNPSPLLDSAQRTNEYVSWYLNGTNYRAEDKPLDPKNPDEAKDLISYAGPLRKLLPQSIAQEKQIETIKNRGTDQHNQIAVCANENIFGLFGNSDPYPCYEGGLINAITGDKYRLSDWDGDLSFLNLGFGAWNKRYPPLPWSDENGQPFDSDVSYQKAYQEWKGKSCVILPIVKKLICVDNPLIANKYADLFPYVPLSSTEDRIGRVDVNDSLTIQQDPSENDGVQVSSVAYTPTGAEENLIYVPHMEETTELLGLLQTTYAAKGTDTNGSDNNVTDLFVTDTNCDLTNVRWNTGDDLFGEYGNTPIEGNLDYTVKFSCDFGVLDPTRYNECIEAGRDPEVCRDEAGSPDCKKTANVALSVYTHTPKINELWYRTVFGDMSIFKRMLPQSMTGPAQTLDLPGVTTAKYETTDADATALAGDPDNNRSGSRAEIFIPHLGGIQEYFLKGIQKALRPKDIGGSDPVSGITTPGSGEINCDKNAPEVNLPGVLSKSEYHDLALRWVGGAPGTHAQDCYNDVIRSARGAGVNPMMALWLWVHESDASNYNVSVEDFGVHFGQPEGFQAQLAGFLSRAKIYNRNHYTCQGTGITNDLQAFAYIYKSGRCDNSQPGAEQFWQEMQSQFNWIAPGCTLPDSMTDMEC